MTYKTIRSLLLFICVLLTQIAVAQTVSQRLQKAFSAFENDEQLKHAMSSLYVIDAKTGQVVFDKNSQVRLAPASTQKIITSVTAFEILGKDFRYKTDFSISENLHPDGDNKTIFIEPSLDPTFGSWRYTSTTDTKIFENVFKAIKNKKGVAGIYLSVSNKPADIPDGWIWQDIGNYYGASPGNFIWRENQFDVSFKTGAPKSQSTIVQTNPAYISTIINNNVLAGEQGSGDNAYAYLPIGNDTMLIKGTVPPNRSSFSISVAMVKPANVFLSAFTNYVSSPERATPVKISRAMTTPDDPADVLKYSSGPSKKELVYSHYSPSLDSIVYWFNKKSINLYGETLLKTMALEKTKVPATDSGVTVVKKFWKEKGLDDDELNIRDGSGLSPLNRVTTHAQVEILKYAKSKSWFPFFLQSLPDYNGMTMKSGTISDVKGFCGYHKAKDGKEYIFSFLVNNYSGKTSPLVGKMYKVLDELK